MGDQRFLDIDVAGVVQHHVQGGVPQQQPHRVQVHAVIQAVGGEVVAEAVGAAAAPDPGPALQAVDHDPDRVAGQGLAVVGVPHLVAARRPGLGEVVFQGLAGPAVQGDDPQLGPLAHDAGLVQVGVEIGKLHVGQLLQPEAGVDEQRDNGQVADAQVAAVVLDVPLAGVQHGLDLVVGVGLDLPVMGAGQLEAGRRVFVEVLLFLGPAEEELQHLGVVVDGGRGRLPGGAPPPVAAPAVLLGGDVTQEVREVLPADLSRLGPAPLPGEPLQPREAGLVVFHRALGEVPTRADETGDELC